jgi:hypothetical protein
MCLAKVENAGMQLQTMAMPVSTTLLLTVRTGGTFNG